MGLNSNINFRKGPRLIVIFFVVGGLATIYNTRNPVYDAKIGLYCEETIRENTTVIDMVGEVYSIKFLPHGSSMHWGDTTSSGRYHFRVKGASESTRIFASWRKSNTTGITEIVRLENRLEDELPLKVHTAGTKP